MYLILPIYILLIIYNPCMSVSLPRNEREMDPDVESIDSRADNLKVYAGLGFDLIVANPFDNFADFNTFGFRAPILVQPRIRVDKFKNLKIEQDGSLWVRNVDNCYQDYQPHYIENGSDLISELLSDFTLDNPFSEAIWERNVNGLDLKKVVNRDSTLKVIKCYCSLFESGLTFPYTKISKEFLNAVEKLPTEVEGPSDCPIDVFITEDKGDKCDRIRAWMGFFKVYGTHVTTHVIIGGKFINMETFVSLHLDNLDNKSGVNKNVQTSDVFKTKIKGTKLKKHLWVTGGSFVKGLDEINPKTFSLWVRTIKSRPMPIKAKFSMLSSFFPEKHQAYLDSLEYYNELIGVQG